MRQVRLCFSEIRGGSPSRPGRHARVKKDALHVDAGVAVEGVAREAVFPSGEGIYDESFDHLVFDSRGERSWLFPGKLSPGTSSTVIFNS